MGPHIVDEDRLVFLPVVCPESGPSPAASLPWRTCPGPHSWGAGCGRLPGGCGGCGTESASALRSDPGSSRARREAGKTPVLRQPSRHIGWAGWLSGWGPLWSISLSTAWCLVCHKTCKGSRAPPSHPHSECLFCRSVLRQSVKSLEYQDKALHSSTQLLSVQV